MNHWLGQTCAQHLNLIVTQFCHVSWFVGHLEKLASDPKVDLAKKEEYISVASQVMFTCLLLKYGCGKEGFCLD